MNLRGEIVAVLDLLRLLGFSAQQIRDHSRVVIVRHGLGWQASKVTGLLADQLRGVVEVEPGQIQPAPATLPSGVSGYLRGVVSGDDQPLLVLDLERILGAEALAPFAGGKAGGRISNTSTQGG
jgi:purine-binding chemotaxis protein CheW